MSKTTSKRIAAAVDLGFDPGWEKRAMLSVQQARWLGRGLAGGSGLLLELIHVSEARSRSTLERGALEMLKRMGSNMDQLDGLAGDEPKSVLRRLAGEGKVHAVVLQGNPVDKLATLASKKSQYEALVLATHGRTGLSRVLLGSVAEEVLRHARIPVVVLGPACQQGAAAPGTEAPLFVVATDLGPNSHAAEKLALNWGTKLGARGLLVHSLREGLHPVIQTAFGAGSQSRELESVIAPHRQRARKNLEQRSRAWSRAGLECAFVLDESHASAQEAVLAAARNSGPALIFAGTHGRTLPGRAFLGSTLREVLLQAKAPVVTVRS